jgi:hypothetical protein
MNYTQAGVRRPDAGANANANGATIPGAYQSLRSSVHTIAEENEAAAHASAQQKAPR